MTGQKERIWAESCESPVGTLRIIAGEKGIKEVRFGGADKEKAEDEPNAMTRWAIKELKEYFQGTRKEFTLPCMPEGTVFQKKVWEALCRIPYGETRTYKEIAEAVGDPRASRAVGMANNKNPLPIIVPCHRVIGSNGKLTGYAGGLDMKAFLLELERKNSEED